MEDLDQQTIQQNNKAFEALTQFSVPRIKSSMDGILGIVDTDHIKENTNTTYLSWDETWIEICNVIAKRSKDPKRKVGALIVNDDHKIISIGYNGMPKTVGMDNDKVYPWGKQSSDPEETKYPYVVHAELNAILNANQSVKGCTLYVNYNCCNECCKAIVQSGIKKVVYTNHKDKNIYNIGRKILSNAGVEVIEICD